LFCVCGGGEGREGIRERIREGGVNACWYIAIGFECALSLFLPFSICVCMFVRFIFKDN